MSILPYSRRFDQQTMSHLLDADPLVQRYRTLFALFDWSMVPDLPVDPSQPGKRAHPVTAYLKALLLKLEEGLTYCTRLRQFLVEHPLLVLELGFRPFLNVDMPYGFDVERTVPSARWFRAQQQHLSHTLLQTLLMRTVELLADEIPGLGEVVSFDVTHIYAWVRENNPRVYVEGPFTVNYRCSGDPDCRLGVKKSSNQEQADGTVKIKKESLFGYGSGIASCTDPVYGDVILAEYTQPFNEGDITYFFPLYVQTVATLGRFPTHIAADAAFDAWYCYQGTTARGGMAAIALNQHGHPESKRDADGVPLCEEGLRMVPTFQFSHTYGYRTQRFRCPLLYPQATGQTCPHAQFQKGKGCVKDLNWEIGGLARVTLKRDDPFFKAVYRQRTSTERGNSHSKALGLAHPRVRQSRSVRNLNTLTYVLINLHALQRAKTRNASLFTTLVKQVV